MATTRDLYEVLGVPHEASDEDIRKAYRRLARELHPDVSGDPDAEERFKEIAGAYEILADPEKRAQYDAFGATGGPGGGFTDIQDIFDMFFGPGGFGGGFGSRRRGPRSRARGGEDAGVRVMLSFSEAAFGVRREIELERMVQCDRCLGNGAEPGTAPIPCRTCGGTGEVQSVRRSVFGTLMTTAPCRTCEGSGREIPDPCRECSGSGRLRRPATVTVDIPGGVSDGIELRVAGGGHAGVAGGAPGDLFVRIDVEPSARFERRGQDLYAVLDIPVTRAALGGSVEIETLDDRETLKIEAGTESGTVVRLKGKGVPNLSRRGRGDLFVTLHVVTPNDLSREEKQLLERLAELRGDSGKDSGGELRKPGF